ncbi:hypothetical protein GC089_03000 [Cellulomonas sp. JZ18]|uniref:hypothetical protein n=1 Tax=Cellulomonas sp. JZ18 TaxID=2654191 RepID=UPI0012D46918|nr:hypothetical protein [Cellulomonas sp. JZ18]QGQ18411.1 hypothetical protein GC089_03000 [Cellulomonas sp. JZ18]
MTRRRPRAAALVVALVAAVAGTASPAEGAPPAAAPAQPVTSPVTVCSGVRDAPVLVAGDLLVDGQCVLGYTAVLGEIRTTPGSRLFLNGAGRTDGDVHLAPGAIAALTGVHVGGGIHLDDVDRLYLTTGSVARSIRGRAARVEIERTRVGGALNVAVPEATTLTGVRLVGAEVGGWVNLYGGTQDVAVSTLRRGLTMSWARRAAVCGTSVLADVTVRRARGPVHVSGAPWLPPCSPGTPPVRNAFGANLLLHENGPDVRVDGTDVAGDLDCRGATTPVVGDVTVGGARLGRCA